MVEIIVITGFYTGKNTCDSIVNLTKYLRDWSRPDKVKITEFLYRYNTISVNHNDLLGDARRLTVDPNNDLIVLAHSRGALVAYEASRIGSKVDTMFLFGAALDNDLVWPNDCAKIIYNVYNPRDLILRAGSLLPNPFKNPLGVAQSACHDPRIYNIDANERHHKRSWVNPHSDYFHKANVSMWGKEILRRCNILCKSKLEK